MLGKALIRLQNNLFIKALLHLISHDGLAYAGYLAYLNFFAIFPLFIILISSISFFHETQAAVHVIRSIIEMVPPSASKTVTLRIQEIIDGPPVKVWSFVFIGGLWTITSSLEGLRSGLNKIYKVTNPPFFVISMLLSCMQFVAVILIFLSSIFIFIILPKYWGFIENIMGINLPLDLSYFKESFAIIIMILLVCYLYKFLIHKHTIFRKLIPGATINVLSWVASFKLLFYFLDWSSNYPDQTNLVYGSLGGITATLLFFYIANLAILYGASFNFVLEKAEQKQLLP